ncbi:tripartite tricarboxylate transporter TctB family protein [Roseixanthobacter liquoris]|uniref:tripartite tricarboxylate transporter TctB family protein n=1 Tax=Roseixanthobacter liquoris TaxID=3119921 RepID=UPI0037279FE8
MISRFRMDVGFALLVALAGAVVSYNSLENGIAWGSSGPEPGYFPFYVGCLIILGACGVLGEAVVRRREEAEPFVTAAKLAALARFFLPVVAFALVSAVLGLYIGMALYVFYALAVPGGFRWPTCIGGALAVTIVSFIVFEKLFQVPLLKGPVLDALGIY